MKPFSILIVDDEEIVLKTLYLDLQSQGYVVSMATDADAALELLKERNFDLVISDLVMQGMSGMQLLREVKARSPETMTLVLSGFGSWTTDWRQMLEFADDFLVKPCQPQEIYFRLQRCLEWRSLKQRLATYENYSKTPSRAR
jgi:DNA-binding NtrC family response regulator